MTRRRTRWPLLLSALAAALPAAAQQAPQAFGEALHVTLVNVEVFATDARGRPVLDLVRDDFRVLEDGRPVEVTHFVGPAVGAPPSPGEDAGAAAVPTAIRTVGAEPGRVVVLVDDLHTGPRSRKLLFAQLADVLRESLLPAQEVLVVRFDGGLRTVLEPTAERGRIADAVDSLELMSARQLLSTLDTERGLDQLRLHAQAIYEQWEANPSFAPPPCTGLDDVARSLADEERGRTAATIDTVRNFVNSLAGFPGPKSLIYVSDGLPLTGGQAFWSYAISMCDGTAAQAGITYAFDVSALPFGERSAVLDPAAAQMDMTEGDLSGAWEELAAHANAQQVRIYAVQASGLTTPRSAQVDGTHTTFATDTDIGRNVQDSLVLLARETGGRAILNTNEFRPDLTAALEDARTGYALAYAPPTRDDGRLHKIRVEVERPGVTLRHRTSYYAKTPEDRMADGVLAALYHGGGDNPLGARFAVKSQEPVDRGTAKVRLRIEVPLNTLVLLPQGEVRQGLFSVFLAVRDAAGGTSAVRRKTLPVRIPEARWSDAQSTAFVYEVEVEMKREEHEVAIGIRDELGGVGSWVHRPVRVE